MRLILPSMIFIKILAYPFAMIYNMITRIRNHAYNIGTRKSITFDIPVINVGNLTVGGTGKTPHVEYLVNLLKDQFKLSILSRGYKRETRGYLLADMSSTAAIIGDEPMQFWSKFKPEVKVAVGEDRAMAIPQILQDNEEVNVILLDDAFQHRSVFPGLNILLSDYSRPFYNDLVLPAGRLREARSNANRADVVIITKCPDTIEFNELNRISSDVRRYLKKDQPIFFSSISYGQPRSVFNTTQPFSNEVVGVAGIAKSALFKTHLEKQFNLLNFFDFGDHHKYTKEDVKKIVIKSAGSTIVCTEKDMVKLMEFESEFSEVALFYIPIEIKILNDHAIFNDLVMSYVQEKVIHKD